MTESAHPSEEAIHVADGIKSPAIVPDRNSDTTRAQELKALLKKWRKTVTFTRSVRLRPTTLTLRSASA